MVKHSPVKVKERESFDEFVAHVCTEVIQIGCTHSNSHPFFDSKGGLRL